MASAVTLRARSHLVLLKDVLGIRDAEKCPASTGDSTSKGFAASHMEV